MLTKFNKVNYVSKKTIIGAENLNNIQDSVLDNTEKVKNLNTDIENINYQLEQNTNRVESLESRIENELGDLDKYVTESELESKGYLTQHQSLTDYAKKSDLNSLSLGVHTDGMIYLFKNGQPIGDGVAQSAQSGDVVGYVDSENNIVLTGLLPNGAYKMKYQYEDGTFSDAIDVTIGDVETYKNLLPEAMDEGLTQIYNDIGYKENVRWSGSADTFVSDAQAVKCVTTGLMPIEDGDVFHIRGVDRVSYVDGRQSGWAFYYDENGARTQMKVSIGTNATFSTDENGDFTIAYDKVPNNSKYVRFTLGQIVGDFIISKNTLIP